MSEAASSHFQTALSTKPGHSKGDTLDTLSRLEDRAVLGDWGNVMDIGGWLRRLGLESGGGSDREASDAADHQNGVDLSRAETATLAANTAIDIEILKLINVIFFMVASASASRK
jgi:hypothetical protein